MKGESDLRKKFISICYGLVFVLVVGRGAAFAEIPLANQPPPPPPGTVITHANWEQYKDYMTLGQQLLWDGKMFWKFAPDLKWRVVATKPWPIPPYYKADTAKYSGQVHLKKLPNGGTVLENYVAGLPFPQITEPDTGAKVLQNIYYRFTPFVYDSGDVFTVTVDRFGNSSDSMMHSHTFRLAHLSDPKLPHTVPGNAGIYYTGEQQLLEPETAKYVTQLNVDYVDQTRVEGLWSFIPSLRRVLRNSASSRCSPSVAGDLYREDTHGGFFGGNWRFLVKLVAHKKLLVCTNFSSIKGSWPTPEEVKAWGFYKYVHQPPDGEWEVRDVYVIELMPTPDLDAGYCYKPKRIYADSEMFAIPGEDVYDAGGKLWKMAMFGFHPLPDGYGNSFMGQNSDGFFTWLDIQNQHDTQILGSKGVGNLAVPEDFRNIQKWAMPSGLAMIMQ